jgi:hypothetical protein
VSPPPGLLRPFRCCFLSARIMPDIATPSFAHRGGQ